jgi:hypothetical protein
LAHFLTHLIFDLDESRLLINLRKKYQKTVIVLFSIIFYANQTSLIIIIVRYKVTLERMKKRAESNKNAKYKSMEKEEDVALLINSKLEPIFNDNDDDDEEIQNHVESNKDKQQNSLKQNLKHDYGNIAILLVLYFLQGIPLGLTGSLPLLLTSRKVSYADQGN